MSDFTAAAIQMSATLDKAANLEMAERLVREAASRGASLVALPELFHCLGSHRAIVDQAEEIPGPTSKAMCALAADCGITLLAGSMAERCPQESRSGDDGAPGKAFNTSLLIGPGGDVLAKYSKVHLFDVELEGAPSIAESQWFAPGPEEGVSVTATPLGRMGQSICYDLRFPELFRGLADLGAEIIFVPAAFTEKTGRAHWEVLLRARAIENQAFVIAPNQFGEQVAGVPLYGHSMIIDPWGNILAQAPEAAGGQAGEEAVVLAEISLKKLAAIRSQIPALRHRRLK